jgi:NADH pyrophosphatase NudC (nudix superfamily)
MKKNPTLKHISLTELYNKLENPKNHSASALSRAKKVLKFMKKHKHKCAKCGRKDKLTIDHVSPTGS